MGNGEDCAIFKLFLDNFLYPLIVFDIDVRCGLIDDNDFAFFHKGSADTEQLFFTCWKIIIIYFTVQTVSLHDHIV